MLRWSSGSSRVGFAGVLLLSCSAAAMEPTFTVEAGTGTRLGCDGTIDRDTVPDGTWVVIPALPEVPAGRLGSCAAALDASNHGVWGGRGAAADASMRLLRVGPRTLRLELSDDTWVRRSETSWLFADHVELWAGPLGGDDCAAGLATQWAVPVFEGEVVRAAGPDGPLPVVTRSALPDGTRALEITLPWSPRRLTVHYSDSDDGTTQERLVGTGPVDRRGIPALLSPVRDLSGLAWCRAVDGDLTIAPLAGHTLEAYDEEEGWFFPPVEGTVRRLAATLPCAGCTRFDAGTDAAGRALTVVRVDSVYGSVDQLDGEEEACGADYLEIAAPDGRVVETRFLDEVCPRMPVPWGSAGSRATVGPNTYTITSSHVTAKSGNTHRVIYQLSPWQPLESEGDDFFQGPLGAWTWDYRTMTGTTTGPGDDAVPEPSRPVFGHAVWGRFGEALLGDCAVDFDASAPAWGPPKATDGPQLRVMAVSNRELWAEVRAAGLDTGAESWVHRDHLELWVADNIQYGIGLPGGEVFRGANATADPDPPQVEVVERGERLLVRLRFTKPRLQHGVQLVYSDAEDGKQVRLIGTGRHQPGVEGTRIRWVGGRCHVVDGALRHTW